MCCAILPVNLGSWLPTCNNVAFINAWTWAGWDSDCRQKTRNDAPERTRFYNRRKLFRFGVGDALDETSRDGACIVAHHARQRKTACTAGGACAGNEFVRPDSGRDVPRTSRRKPARKHGIKKRCGPSFLAKHSTSPPTHARFVVNQIWGDGINESRRSITMGRKPRVSCLRFVEAN